MSNSVQCPECKTQCTFEPQEVQDDTIICPNCHLTVSVFGDDTWVPENDGSPVSVSAADLQIEGYQIVKQLGQGGMGVVFEGRQISLGRRVAIKVLSPNLAGEGRFVKRFEREAAALAQLAHPNIVTIFERGRSGNLFYFIMEYVEGESSETPTDLRSLLDQRQLTISEIKHLVLQVARALSYSHSNGIVHRDVKPGNVLIDPHGNAKLADFGIASMGVPKASPRVTMESSVLGTHDYMAPEQQQDTAAVNHLADVFSVGVLIYEMLTGRIPKGVYQPASQIRLGLSPEWDEIISNALQSQPSLRLSSMLKLIESLELASTELKPEQAARPTDAKDGLQKVEAGDQKEGHAKTTGFTSQKCPQCDCMVGAEARFCPECRSAMSHPCHACDVIVGVSVKYCPNCGEDLHAFRESQECMETAVAALQIATDRSEQNIERFEQAKVAGLAAARGLVVLPNDKKFNELVLSANEIKTQLATRLANAAHKEKNLSQTLSFLEQVLEVTPTNTRATELKIKVEKFFLESKAKADRLLQAGAPKKAIGLLEKLSKSFPDDQNLSNELDALRNQDNVLDQFIHKTIPALVEKKNWWSIHNEVNRFSATGEKSKELASLKTRAERKLNSVTSVLEATRESIYTQPVSVTRSNAEKVLAHVADHPEAIQIHDAAIELEQNVNQCFSEATDLCDQGRWFAAWKLLAPIELLADPRKFENLASKIGEGKSLANRFSQLIIWCVLGGFLFNLAAFVGRLLQAGMVEICQNFENLSSRFRDELIPTAVFFISFQLLVVTGLWACRVLLDRSIKPTWHFFLINAIWLLGTVLFFVFAQFEKILDDMNSVLAFVGTYALIGVNVSVAITLLSRGLVGSQRQKTLSWHCLGTVAFAIAVLTEARSNTFLPAIVFEYLIPAIWLHSWLLITKVTDSWWRTTPIIVMGAALGILALGVETLDSPLLNYLQFWFAVATLAGLGIVLTKHRTISSICFVSMLTAVFASCWQYSYALASLSAFWLIASIIAAKASPVLEPRLHLRDRISSPKIPDLLAKSITSR